MAMAMARGRRRRSGAGLVVFTVITCLLVVLTLATGAELLLAEQAAVQHLIGPSAGQGVDNDEEAEGGEIASRLVQLLDVIDLAPRAVTAPRPVADLLRLAPRPRLAVLAPLVRLPPPR
jgi:hypothetical protein